MHIQEILGNIENELREADEFLLDIINRQEECLKGGCAHLLQAGGKRIRPAFIILGAKYGSEEIEKAIPLAAAMELVHMATLIHDDVIDHSQLRRGKPTLNCLFGNNFSLHLGSFLFAKALNLIEKYKNPRINYLVTKVSVEICRGEIEQLETAFNPRQNTRDYFSRIRRKTSLLFSICCQVGALAAMAPLPVVRALGRFGHYFGMAYQITDDVLDYIADESTLGKPVASDLRQGFLTLPSIFALKYGQPETKSEIQLLLVKKATKEEDIQRVLQLIRKSEALKWSLGVAGKYIEKSLRELERLPANDSTQTLKNMALFVQRRSS